MEITKNVCVLSFGSNIGESIKFIHSAFDELSKNGQLVQISPFYQSAPWGFESENNFINCCAEFHTFLNPFELLDCIIQIEKKLGRKSKTIEKNYSDRVIDVDILFFNDLIINDERLTIPHPLYSKRNFVLFPLNDIFHTFVDPKTKLTVAYQKLNSGDKSPLEKINCEQNYTIKM